MQTPSYQQVALLHFSLIYFRFIFCFFGATGGIRTRDGVRTAFLFFDLSFQAKSHLAKECSLSPHISPMCRVPILSTGRSLSFFKKLFPLYILFFWSYWRDSNPRRRSHCFLVFRFVFSSQISPCERVLSFPAHIPYVQGPHSINRSLPFIFQKNHFYLISAFLELLAGFEPATC